MIATRNAGPGAEGEPEQNILHMRVVYKSFCRPDAWPLLGWRSPAPSLRAWSTSLFSYPNQEVHDPTCAYCSAVCRSSGLPARQVHTPSSPSPAHLWKCPHVGISPARWHSCLGTVVLVAMPCFPYRSVFQEIPARRPVQKALAQGLLFMLAHTEREAPRCLGHILGMAAAADRKASESYTMLGHDKPWGAQCSREAAMCIGNRRFCA